MNEPKKINSDASWRVLGLVINFIANGLLLFGLAKMMQGEGGGGILIIGTMTTLALIWMLSKPNSYEK